MNRKSVIEKDYGNLDYHNRMPSHDVSRVENLSREQVNHTIDAIDTNSIMPTDHLIGSIGKPSRNQLGFGRRHKYDIPFANK